MGMVINTVDHAKLLSRENLLLQLFMQFTLVEW